MIIQVLKDMMKLVCFLVWIDGTAQTFLKRGGNHLKWDETNLNIKD